MKKRVLYIVPGFNPLVLDGVSNRVNSFAQCFLQNGYQVTIVPLCYHKQYFDVLKKRKNLNSNYKWLIFPYVNLFITTFYHLRYLVEIPLKLSLFFITLFHKYNYVLADYSIGVELASWTRFNTKVIANHRSEPIDETKFLNHLDDNHILVERLKILLKRVVKKSDINICVSRNLQKNIEQYTNLHLHNCFIFPCCADLNRFNSVENNQESNLITIGYFGSLSSWQCIDETINLYKRLKERNPNFTLLILTNSNWDKYKNELDHIGDYVVKSVTRDEIPYWISKMDVSIALRENRSLNIVSSPTKLSESLAAGVPVVVTQFSGDYNDIIIPNKNGLVLDSVQITEKQLIEIENFCLKVKSNRESFTIFCKESVQQRTWNNFSSEFIKYIENL